MFIGYGKARRSGLFKKRFLPQSPSSNHLKNARLAVEPWAVAARSRKALGKIENPPNLPTADPWRDIMNFAQCSTP